jgi:hypothetical protein
MYHQMVLVSTPIGADVCGGYGGLNVPFRCTNEAVALRNGRIGGNILATIPDRSFDVRSFTPSLV